MRLERPCASHAIDARLNEAEGARASVADTVSAIRRSTRSNPMAHKFQIRKNKAGEFVAYFVYNNEAIFWTEGYSSKASAKNAIESIKKNGPDAEVDDQTD